MTRAVVIDGVLYQSVFIAFQQVRRQGKEVTYHGLCRALQNGRAVYLGMVIDYAYTDGEIIPQAITPRLDDCMSRKDVTHYGGLLGRTVVAR